MCRVFKPILFLGLLLSRVTLAAFNVPTSFSDNTVQTNNKGVWCYYPAAGQTTSTSCGGNFNAVLDVHLNTTTSIGYYAPDNTRYGGAEWPVPVTNAGIVTLCVSGMAGDGTYQTACMFVIADNSLPLGTGCLVDIAQYTVTDGCYVPARLAASTSPVSSAPPTSSSMSSTSAQPSTSASLTSTVQTMSTRASSTTDGASKTSMTASSAAPAAMSPLSSVGVIIGIISGIIASIAAVIALCRWAWRRHRRQRNGGGNRGETRELIERERTGIGESQ